MLDNRIIAKLDKRTVVERGVVDGDKYVFDYDLRRHLTQDEIDYGVVFNYDLEMQKEAD